MNRKVFLPLLEQLCMIGFFALAAALCLRGFAFARQISDERYVKDCAVVAAQNTAEVLKSVKGDLSATADIMSGKVDGDVLTILYDKQGNPTYDTKSESFTLCARVTDESSLLGSATVQVFYENEIIFEITVGWQVAEYA